MLHGVTGQALLAQWARLPPATAFAAALRDRQVLLVTGDRDEVFAPRHYRPLVRAVTGLTWRRFAQADHGFSTCRTELVEVVVSWLFEAVCLD